MTVTAVDYDSTSSVTYSMPDSANGLFSIDTNLGVISLDSASLDRETRDTYRVVVEATDATFTSLCLVFTFPSRCLIKK